MSETTFPNYTVQVVIEGVRDFDYPCDDYDEALTTWVSQNDEVDTRIRAGEITEFIVEIWDNSKEIDVKSRSCKQVRQGIYCTQH